MLALLEPTSSPLPSLALTSLSSLQVCPASLVCMCALPTSMLTIPGMTSDDLCNTNANIVKTLTEAVGKYAA